MQKSKIIPWFLNRRQSEETFFCKAALAIPWLLFISNKKSCGVMITSFECKAIIGHCLHFGFFLSDGYRKSDWPTAAVGDKDEDSG